MKFSFLVPVYNTKNYMRECIESLLVQKGEFEIILVDDGSTDESGRICDYYAENYPDVVRAIHKANEGLLLTRRRGFREAKGEWLICVDSDDYVDANLLERVTQTIKAHDCDMVMYNFDYVDDNRVYSPSRLQIPDETVYEDARKQELYEKRLLTVDVNSMCMRAMRRDIVDIDADYSGAGIRNMCEDALQDLAVYTNAKKIVYLSEALYHYRKGQTSITAKASLESWKAIYISHTVTESYLDVWAVPQSTKIKYHTRVCETATNFIRWLANEDNEEQLRQIVEKIRNDKDFKKCLCDLDKKYISTQYMRLVVPIVMKLIKHGNILGLKLLIKMERKILANR